MKEALTLKLAETRDNLKTDPVLAEAKDEQLSEEVSVKLMADLQERQTIENNALLQAMAQAVSILCLFILSYALCSHRNHILDNTG